MRRHSKIVAAALALAAVVMPIESALALGLPVMQRGLLQGSEAGQQFKARILASLHADENGNAPIAGGTCGYSPRMVYQSIRQLHPELGLAENPTPADLRALANYVGTLELRQLSAGGQYHNTRMVQNGASCTLDTVGWSHALPAGEWVLVDRNTGQAIMKRNCANVIALVDSCFTFRMAYLRERGVKVVNHGARVVVRMTLTPAELQQMLADRCTTVIDRSGEHAPRVIDCTEACPGGGAYPPNELAQAVGLPPRNPQTGRGAETAIEFIVADGEGQLRLPVSVVRRLRLSLWCVDAIPYPISVRSVVVNGTPVDYSGYMAQSYWDIVENPGQDIAQGVYHQTLAGASSFRVAAN